jgi:hypothetical protein
MATDWIKVEKTTPRKSEVLRIATTLNIHPDHAFGLCFRFWSWCDDNLLHSNAGGVSLALVDSLVDRSGFCAAMVSVGWLKPVGETFEVTKFERHLSKSAKTRGLTAKRVSKHERKTNAGIVSEALTELELELELDNTTGDRFERAPEFPEADISAVFNSKASIIVFPDGRKLDYEDDPMVWQAEFIRQWNQLPHATRHGSSALVQTNQRLLFRNLHDPDWDWAAAFRRFPVWRPGDAPATMSWFLSEGVVNKILEGDCAIHAKQKGNSNGKPRTGRAPQDNTGSLLNPESGADPTSW